MIEKQQEQLGNFIKNKVLKFEAIIVLIIAFDIMFKKMQIPGFGLINTLVLSTISLIYFFSAFQTIEDSSNKGIDMFVTKLLAWASSTCLIGILFHTQKWPGSPNMLIVGSVILIPTLIYIFIQLSKNPESKIYNKWMAYRAIVLIIFSIGFFLGKI